MCNDWALYGATTVAMIFFMPLIQPTHALPDRTEALRQALGSVKFTGLITA